MADEEESGAPEVEEAPKRSKMPMIITLLAGLLLGGGGAAGYFIMFAPKPEATDKVAVDEAEAAKEKVAKLKPIFVIVDRVSAPLVAPDAYVVGHVSMYIRLQVKNADDQDWVRDRLPMVRHAINLAVSRVGVNFPDDAMKVDYEGAAQRISDAVNDYLKTDKVLAAHITEAVRL